MTTFYRMRLIPTEEGLVISTETFHSIRETPSVHWCLTAFEHNFNRCQQQPGETEFETARRRQVKIWRILKNGSRIAQPTEEAAFQRLKYIKTKHLLHLQRDTEILEAFLVESENKTLADFPACHYGHRIMRGTAEKVNEHYSFY